MNQLILAVIAILSMGFTVPVIALDSALPGGAMQEAARLGLAVSLFAGPLALLLWRGTGSGAGTSDGTGDRTGDGSDGQSRRRPGRNSA